MRCRLFKKLWWKRPLFLLMNCLVNMADMITDSLTVVYLWDFEHPHWALITLFWMFVPFFLHLTLYLVKVFNYYKFFILPGGLAKWSGWSPKDSKEAEFRPVLIRVLVFIVHIFRLGYNV